MAGETFTRPRDGFRFKFGGMKVNSSPDTLAPDKYPFAQNIRAVTDRSVETRPGQTRLFVTGTGAPITDLRAYAALSTDNNSRILARDNADAIWLDNGVSVGTLAGGGAGQGATLLPFRPNQSPNPYMYIANGSDYQKFSAPNVANAVVQKNVGIKEPQSSPDAVLQPQQFTELLAPMGAWNTGGTASAWSSGNRSSDISSAALPDPAAPASSRFSVQVGHIAYAVGEIVMFQGTPPVTAIIEDVIAPLSIQMTVQAIYYFTGTSGRCVIVPQGINEPSGNVTENKRTTQSGVAAPQFEFIASLRRGALIRIGTEVCYVWSVTEGPNQQIAIETSTVGTHAVGENLVGLPTIVVNGIPSASSVSAGVNIIGDQGNTESFQVAIGIGTLTTGSAGGGSLGTVIASPTTFLNGWGPNAHVGLTPNDTFGLDPNTTQPYTNPANAFDGSQTTFAFAVGENTNLPRNGCVWKFNTPASGPSGATLNILSEVPTSGTDGFQVGGGESALYYSLDGGTTWIQVYFSTVPRAKQWDRIPLSASQDYTKIQVMANMYPHNHMYHKVYEINITSPSVTPSIGASTGAYQDDDYIHFSLYVDNYLQLTEVKIQFDVSDGTFSTNYFYYSVRPSDLVQAAANTLTQLGAIQDILQQDSVHAFSGKTGLAISAPTVAGAGQWTEVWFPISALTRVGGDQTKSMANIVDIQILVNALATVNVKVSSIAFVGGSAPNVGDADAGEPYLYRIRPRDSRTGARGNPSPATRYGAAARRQQVELFLPSAAYDAQIDTWDVFRFGGSVPSWRFIGTAPSTSTTFFDNYDDDAANAGEALDFDNFEPWPSVDLPLIATATQVTGFIAVVTIPSPTNALRFLPGNLVKIAGQNVYTLRERPILLTGTSYQFEFVENAGAATNASVNIYEPEIARQFLPYMWGPDVNGTVFACGDPLRPGTLYFAKPNNPDSAPDTYSIEITPPTEPLLGGEIVDGLSFVGSPERWWALYPQLDNPAQRYNFVEQPFTRGLAAPRGHCTDGASIHWWAKDGIWSSTKGSLTDADLYSLFPHEGVIGRPSTYGTPPLGHTVQPPDYSQAGTFRLEYANYYLYATYKDSMGAYITLVYDTRRDAWCVDVYGTAVSVFYHPEQQPGTLLSATTRYPEVLMADTLGNVSIQTAAVNDLAGPIPCRIAVAEYDGGDARAPKQWGDFFIDGTTASAVTVQPMSLANPVGVPATLGVNAVRSRQPVSIGGLVVSDFLGMILTWTDDFTSQNTPTTLNIWQPSFDIQPAYTIAWTTFGTSFGLEGYGHIREIVAAYVSTQPVTLTIIPFDGQAPAPIVMPSTGGQYRKVLFPVSANKGQLFAFKASSSAVFQFFLDDWEIRLGAWRRSGPYIPVKTFSGQIVASAPT